MMKKTLAAGVLLTIVVAGCSARLREYRPVETSIAASLRFSYRHPEDMFYHQLQPTVGHFDESEFVVYFDNGQQVKDAKATLHRLEDGSGSCELAHVQSPGGFLLFVNNQIRTRDHFGDDYAQWVLVIGALCNLEDALQSDGKSLYVILRQTIAEPPCAAIQVTEFGLVEARKEGSALFFRLKFAVKEGMFPQGDAEIVGSLRADFPRTLSVR